MNSEVKTILLILFTAIIVAAGTAFVFNTRVQLLQEEIEELKSQAEKEANFKEIIEEKVLPESPKITEPSIKDEETELPEESTASHRFNSNTIQEGDTVAGLEAIQVTRDEFTPLSLQIFFDGDITLSGTYNFYEDGILAETVCFKADEDSVSKIPRGTDDMRIAWFCFENQSKAGHEFGPPGSSGKSTVKINNYIYISADTEAHDKAILVEVIN